MEKNQDPRWRDCDPYVFAALYYLEMKRFTQNINISCQRGNVNDGGFQELKDPMSGKVVDPIQVTNMINALKWLFHFHAVFDNIKGTPRYWKKLRNKVV